MAATRLKRFKLYESFTFSMPEIISSDAKASPIRIPASENDFEKVRNTTRLGK